MKKILTVFGLVFFVNNSAFSQDALLFNDGNKKEVTILEITPEVIKYRKFNSISEVIYTEYRDNLIGVIFEDGEFEKFEPVKNRGVALGGLGDYGNSMFFI